MNFQYINHILKTTWLLDESDIQSLIWDLSEDVYEKVYNNRYNYPKMVHQVIEPRDFAPQMKKKLKVINLTDDLWNSMKIQEQRNMEGVIQTKWLEHKKSLPPRDWQVFDEQCDEIYEELSNARKALGEYRQKKSSKYVVPGSRPQQDVNEQMLIEKIEKLKNEFDSAKIIVETADIAYEKNAENLFKQKMRSL
jgi:hypothetical protein